MSCDLIKLRTTIFNGLLSLLLATLTFCPILVYADSVDRDTLFIDSLKVRFDLDEKEYPSYFKSGFTDNDANSGISSVLTELQEAVRMRKDDWKRKEA